VRRIPFALLLLLSAVVVLESCAFDDTLREYLNRHFWLQFSRHSVPFERKNVRRASTPYAGMDADHPGNDRLVALRRAYEDISDIDGGEYYGGFGSPSRVERLTAISGARKALEAASADTRLTAPQKEEVALVAAKIDMRQAELNANDPQGLRGSRQKFQSFVRSARSRAFASEARGWIGHVDWLLGDRTAAGKIYLDELNRDGSNLSRETILNSLQLVYGYDGGADLRSHIADYFDTAAHAAFAIQLVSNPHTKNRTPDELKADTEAYNAIMELADKHRNLFDSPSRPEALTLLLMRTALRMGDPQSARNVAGMLPADSSLFEDVDLNWMEASAYFILHDYQEAEKPLQKMFMSRRASADDKAAAAYGLVGVYEKVNNPVEQLHFALWLQAQRDGPPSARSVSIPTRVEDRTLYLAFSGWDLAALLDYQLPVDVLVEFINRYRDLPRLELVRYAVAVRKAREDRYEEAAAAYAAIGASGRAARMRQVAALFDQTKDAGFTNQQRMEAEYRFAEFLDNNSERVYFNNRLWDHFQNDALIADSDSRLTREERDAFTSGERELRDLQEERWRAYLVLNRIVEESGRNPLGRKAAQLAIRCLRGIATRRFGREQEIAQADIRLSNWLKQLSRPPQRGRI
jgi:hypothetical protein